MRGGPRWFNPGFPCPDLLRSHQRSRSSFVYRALTFYGRTFQSVRLPVRFVTPPVHCGAPKMVLLPRRRNAHRLSRRRFGLSPLSLATTQGIDTFLSLPPGTQMCHFPGFPPDALCVQAPVTGNYTRRVSPFGHPRFIARLRLHAAYRSLPRPSSAFGAKASTIRSYYLNGI